MSTVSNFRPARLLLVVFIVLFSSSCADDADRIERAREHQENAEYRAAIIELKNVLRSDADNIEARTLLGVVSLQDGDSEAAIKELRKARELGATPNQYAVALARALLRESRYQEVIKSDPDSVTDKDQRAALLALIGMGEIQRGDLAAAEKNFSAALELVPDQADALIGSSRLAGERGDVDAAESSLAKLLKTRPDDSESLAALARLQQAKGEFAQAEDNYRKALEAIEGSSKAHERMLYTSGLIEALLAQDKNAQAQALGTKMIQETAQHPLALYQAARADYASGNYDGAIDKSEQLISVTPSAERPRMLIAGAAMAQGNTTLAATHLQAAVDINPGNEKARKLLAAVRMKMGDPEEARALLEPLIAAGTEDAQLLAMAGTASIRSGNPEAGMALVERGMEAGSSNPALALQAATNFLAAGEINRAIEVLESLPEADRVGHRELLLILALLTKGDEAGARAKAESMVNDHPESSEAHRLLGGFHLAVGEYDQSRSEFEKALTLNPGDIGAVVNLARIDVVQQKPEQAEARFRVVLDSTPGNLLALTALSELALTRGDAKASIDFLEQARTSNPDAVEPLMLLGSQYLDAGNLQLAEERAKQAVRISGSDGNTHTLLGLVMMGDGRESEAIGHFESAVLATPNLVTAHYHLGRALAITGKDEESFDAYQRATEIDSTFFPARAALTMAAIKRGDLNHAMSIAESLVADYPDRGEPLMLKAHVQTQSKDFQAALESYNSAAAIRPSREIAAKVYQIQNGLGVDKPWKELESWVNANPNDASARAMLAAAYTDAGKNDLARENFEQVMATAPDVRVAMNLAKIERSAGDLDATVAWLQKAVELEPTALPARAALASLQLERGNTQAANTLLRALRQDHPDAVELHSLEGDTLLATGDFKGSIDAYDRALETQPSELVALKRYQAGRAAGDEDAWRVLETWFSGHPGHINAGLQLAQDYGAREWNDEAIDVYRRVLTTDPNNMVALNNIAWAYADRSGEGDAKRGLAAASKAYKLAPQNVAIADTYGWVLLKDGQNEEAEKILSAVARDADADPEIIYHYAVALDALDRDAEAAAALDRVLTGDTAFESREDAEILRRRLLP